ncbi:DNA uptake lipoprotein-like [Acidisarcina polymorpha]|uniref:DNA uptake lipoprotein-like n=1 Tax=Acidisarcina polymorpha TaxID=2211140 RepID=A0A2Z5G7T6_9BACT|nr:outer membrane protein assembly factor BamD [Acidisarcina polymorpha]AXC15333.1 DNA uptake lipoprotein-like [Acidisarcina polymorpha]
MQRLLLRISGALLLTALVAPAHGEIFGKKKSGSKPNTSNPLANLDSKQPDKELYDKAMVALKKGRYDVCRLDLQTLLNTYPDSEYQMRAKLAVGDSWFKEGGSAAYTQAESEYKDFITFFPNVPEAAEAQMRVADIYYMQMEKPDRDYTNVQRAEQEYRQMINQFPDSTLIPRAQQHLRDVQEVLAQREYQIGTFYESHENWAASIARLQTVADSYPLFSHSDLNLIALGDAFAAEARATQAFKMPEGPKEQLIRIYNDQAAAAYSRVVTKYAMAPHVEDAKDRLLALGHPVPEPTKEELAESQAEEESRVPVKLSQRAVLLFTKAPSTVAAAHVGQPTMVDPPATYAPQVSKATMAAFNAVIAGKTPAAPVQAASTDIQNGTAPPRSDQPAPAPRLEDVPNSGGTGVGAEIVTPSNNGTSAAPPTDANPPAAAPANPPNGAASPAVVNGAPVPTAVPDNGGLRAVGPTDTTTLPAVDKPAEAPSQVNDVKAAPAVVTTGTTSAAAASKKGDRGKFDPKDESSSKHKKKKGLDKLNPF